MPFISQSKIYQRLQKRELFQFLRPNSGSVTKIDLNWCLICQNWQKIGQFQAISRVPENSWKFPGMMKFLNSALKIKFLDINWVGFIPYMLKSVKNSQFQGNIQSSRKFLEVSRNDGILKFCVENPISWHKLSGIHTLHVEISQN